MSDRSLVPVPEPKKRGEYQVSPRVRRALEALASGEARTQNAAAKIAGLTPRALSGALRRPAVVAYRNEMARETLRAAVPRASRRMVELLEQDEHKMTAFRAGTFVLGAGAGVVAPNANSPGVNVTVQTNNVGYVLDLRHMPADQSIMTEVGGVRSHAAIGPVGGVLLDEAPS